MNYLSNKQIVYVDSTKRTNENDSHSNFSYIINIDNKFDFDRVSLLDCTIPKSNYTISNNNNTFTVEENSVQRLITIPVGNYSRKSFKNVLQTKLNENPETGYSNYIVTYDSSSSTGDTGKYTFNVTSGANPEVQFIFGTGLTDQAGFNTNTTYTFSSGVLISPNVSNFRSKITFFLKSTICQNTNNNILQNIVASSGDFDYIYYTNQNPYEYHKDFVKESSNVYQFTIVDEDNKIVDLNGLGIVLTLMLWKENKISDLIKGYIKMKVLKMV
eukprot:Lithocolla_globosa_v1_NODE_146_length_5712_cov_12.381121.p3 type:complete len:272 gc:universal NODE_146_length_5712_cov_12.381121:3879-3064(-)